MRRKREPRRRYQGRIDPDQLIFVDGSAPKKRSTGPRPIWRACVDGRHEVNAWSQRCPTGIGRSSGRPAPRSGIVAPYAWDQAGQRRSKGELRLHMHESEPLGDADQGARFHTDGQQSNLPPLSPAVHVSGAAPDGIGDPEVGKAIHLSGPLGTSLCWLPASWEIGHRMTISRHFSFDMARLPPGLVIRIGCE